MSKHLQLFADIYRYGMPERSNVVWELGDRREKLDRWKCESGIPPLHTAARRSEAGGDLRFQSRIR